MNRTIAVIVIALSLARTSYGDNGNVQLEAHRLGKVELQSWIENKFKTGGVLTFASNEGQGLCCDVGSITLEMRRGNGITISVNEYAGVEFSLPYTIQPDGKISLASNSAYPIPALQNIRVRGLYVYSFGSSVYMVRDSDVNPNFARPPPSIWPLKYVPSGKLHSLH